ncbi:MAG: 8-oxoguanine deaminase [Burkholderiaceae bacterium]|nr:8-oxoguanine deaminase [Burkholderiaceae bacterium]
MTPSDTPPRRRLLHAATLVATFDDTRRELPGGSVLLHDERIEAVYAAGELPAALLETLRQAGEVIDARGLLLTPGLINTHHHMYQSLTRAVPAAQDAELFGWLRTLYPIWARLTPEMVRVSTQTAMAELLLAGCTTSSDHLYLYPNGVRLDDAIEAAADVGMRFHAARGSMSVGESAGGLPPDALVEREDRILADTQRLIETYDDAGRYSRLRIVAAPCSPFSVSPDLMRESAALARSLGTRLHTHLAENDHDVAYSRARFGMTPTEYAQSVGWLGEDVWHAHCVQLDAEGIARFAATGTGVAHCPCSNMRLASGIAPVRRMLDAGVPVGLGVDGSASNDGAHLLAEARQALLLARVGRALAPPEVGPDGQRRYGCDLGPAEMTARQVLELATRGGARVLGRAHDLGQITPGYAADLVLWRLDGLAQAGAAVHDPLAALVFTQAPPVALALVGGRVLVQEGRLTTLDLGPLLERHNRLARQLLRGEP